MKHPVAGFIACNVYVFAEPVVVVNDVGEVTPPNQLAVAVPGVADPVKVTVATPHINVCVGPAFTEVGVVVF